MTVFDYSGFCSVIHSTTIIPETHRSSCFAINEFLHGLEPEHGVLDPLKQRPRPADGTCHRGLGLGNGRVRLAILKESIDAVYFLLEGGEDIVEFLHHSGIDGLPGTDILEVVQHVKGSLCRSQALKGLVDEAVGFIFNQLDFSLKAGHDSLPL